MKFSKNKKRIDPRYFLHEAAIREIQSGYLEGTDLLSIKQSGHASKITSNVLNSLKEFPGRYPDEKIYNSHAGKLIAVRAMPTQTTEADIYLGRDTPENEEALKSLGYKRVNDLHVP